MHGDTIPTKSNPLDGLLQPGTKVTEALKQRKKGSWGSPAEGQAAKDQPSPASCAT